MNKRPRRYKFTINGTRAFKRPENVLTVEISDSDSDDEADANGDGDHENVDQNTNENERDLVEYSNADVR